MPFRLPVMRTQTERLRQTRVRFQDAPVRFKLHVITCYDVVFACEHLNSLVWVDVAVTVK